MRGARLLLLALLLPFSMWAEDGRWIRPLHPGDPLVWGIRDGLVFGIPSPGGMKGPRGLIRVGVVAPGDPAPQVLNYLAIEPVVAGPGSRSSRMAFSELEASVLDPGEHGKRMWLDQGEYRGRLRKLHGGVERLSVTVEVEPYTANGARVYLLLSMESDHPQELRINVFAKPDSPRIEQLTVTATMGNYERLRLLWLKDRVIDSRQLFAGYGGDGFAEADSYPLDEVLRDAAGDAIVYASSSESDPQTTAGNSAAHWPYRLPRYTQYWRVPAADVKNDLRVRVNARRVYWRSTAPVLGGIAFENFEVRQGYAAGQTFVFGISKEQPWEMDGRLQAREER